MRTPIIELVNSGELGPIEALKMCIGWMGDHEEQAMLEDAGYEDESCEEKIDVHSLTRPVKEICQGRLTNQSTNEVSPMFDKNPTQEQSLEIDKIVNRFIKAALKSRKETAFQDAERNGMDAVRKYCRDQGLAIMGNHMIRANQKLINAES